MDRGVLDWWKGVRDLFTAMVLVAKWSGTTSLHRLLPWCTHIDEETRAIIFTRRMLSLRPIVGFRRGPYLTTLSAMLVSRARRSNNSEDIDRAISAAREAVPMILDDISRNAQLYYDLGLECLARYQHSGQADDLHTCISFYTKALLLCSLQGSIHADISVALVAALHMRISCSDELEDFDGYLDQVQLSLAETRNQKTILSVLAAFLLWRFEKAGDVEDLTMSLMYAQASISLSELSHSRPSLPVDLGETSQSSDPPSELDGPQRLGIMASALLAKFTQFGDVQDLHQSVAFSKDALESCPPILPIRSHLLNVHASSLISRFIQTGHESDLLAGIAFGNEALALHPCGHPRRSQTLVALASAHSARYQLTGDFADIESSINFIREAIELSPHQSIIYPIALMTLAANLQSRLRQEDIEESMNLGQMALSLYPSGSTRRPDALWCLTTSLLLRASTPAGQKDDFALAEQYISEALSCAHPTAPIRIRLVIMLTILACYKTESQTPRVLQRHWNILDHCPPGHLLRPVLLLTIASYYNARHAKTKALSDVNAWIGYTQASLDSYPPDSPSRFSLVQSLIEAEGVLLDKAGSLGNIVQLTKLESRAMSFCPPARHDAARLMITPILARFLFHNYLQTRNAEERDKAFDYYREAMDLCSQDTSHQLQVTIMSSLATVLDERFKDTSSMDELQKSIELRHRALSIYQQGGIEILKHVELLPGLSWGLEQRYLRTGSLSDLEEAIQLGHELLTYSRSGSLVRFSPEQHRDILSGLARLSLLYWQQSSTAEHLERSISYQCEALQVFKSSNNPNNHSTHLKILSQLGISLFRRYGVTNSPDDLNSSIAHFYEFLMLSAHTPPTLYPVSTILSGFASLFTFRRWTQESLRLPISNEVPIVLSELASALLVRHWTQGPRPDDESESILCSDHALRMCVPGLPGRGLVLRNIAQIQVRRFEHSDRREDLDSAIDLFRDTLNEAQGSAGGPIDHNSRTELASALSLRFQCRGDLDDLEESIRLGYSTLSICSTGGVLRETTLGVLAISLAFRFINSRQNEDWTQAVAFLREALTLCPPQSPRNLTNVTSLSALLCWRMMVLKEDNTDLEEECLHHAETAVEICSTGHPNRPFVLHNLARAYQCRFARASNVGDSDRAIEYFRLSLAIVPDYSVTHLSLANDLVEALLMRYHKMQRLGLEDSQKALEESIELGHRQLSMYMHDQKHPERLRLLCNLASSMGLRSEKTHSLEDTELSITYAKDSAPSEGGSNLRNQLQAAIFWARNAHATHHDSALDAFRTCLELTARTFTVTPTVDMQHDVVHSLASLALDAVSCAIDRGELTLAIEMLEEGRTLLWSQMRRWRSPLDDLKADDHRALRDKFFAISRALEMLSTSSNPFSHVLSKEGVSDPYGRMLERKRELLREHNDVIDQLRQLPGLSEFLRLPSWHRLKCVADEGPVVIDHHQPQLKDEFYERSIEMSKELVEARSSYGPGSKAYNKSLCRVLEDLWELVVGPVVETLEEMDIKEGSRIWWCPTSVISSLPLHAARKNIASKSKPKWRYLCDLYVSSYIPTLSSLIEARATALSPMHQPNVLGIALSDDSLKAAKDEIAVLEANFSQSSQLTLVVGEDCKREVVVANLQKSQWTHFICHGVLEPGHPFDSSFKLWGDERLTLLEIIKAGLHDAELAVLSACHTAEQTQNSAPEEVLHLAAAMHFAGFRSVVGTMWAVKDEDGPVFAKHFYEKMLATTSTSLEQTTFRNAARGWRSATVEMRKRRVDLERWVNFVHIGA
ncbi:CHAT domain-containing protein [Irpex rosettiformis]|uniref:CHAT domain-containing protein n=1 Tax=Irpex rosettiformis TaxID=378272 RepID=A0ACB8TY95_9APHY|nr:CHAT domain-containing protein [Irpex rosettiformis]